ncbi:hypothetical protein FD951_13235 [Pseudomonas chlororaphis subsp. aurantiaca]|nr:hypothetical protein FD951_13235 [Pseudomonas chlororaphis subsp. aurantiaca]
MSIATGATPFVDGAQSLAGSFNRAHVGGSADGAHRGVLEADQGAETLIASDAHADCLSNECKGLLQRVG